MQNQIKDLEKIVLIAEQHTGLKETAWNEIETLAHNVIHELKKEPPAPDIENRNCFKCSKQRVCFIRKSTNDAFMSGIIDFNKPGGADWLNLIYGTIAARCVEFEKWEP